MHSYKSRSGGIDPEILMRRKFLLFAVAKKRIVFYIYRQFVFLHVRTLEKSRIKGRAILYGIACAVNGETIT